MEIWAFAAIAVLIINLVSCNSRAPKLHAALSLAGENRLELKKVLTRYSIESPDSLKYKAAVFLIENMPGHFYYEGQGVSDYTTYFAEIRSVSREPGDVIDSLSQILGKFSLAEQTIKYDIETIDSAYLCENIDLAFEAWENYPWSKEYSFEEFCEYILPYRIGTETPTNWRTVFSDNYSEILKTVDVSDPIVAANMLRDSVLSRFGLPRFTMTRPFGYPTVDAITSQQFAGACDDLTQFSISLFRTFGIAVAEDRIPKRGDANVGHSWVAIFDSNGDLYNTDFFGEIQPASETITYASLKAKVYRRHFSSNDQQYGIFKVHDVEIPRGLFNFVYRSTDVTQFYASNLLNLHLRKEQLYKGIDSPKIVFLCAPSWRNWTPIAWGEFNDDGGFTFNNLDAGSILRVAYFDETEIKFLSSPFYAHRKTRDLVFIPDADTSRLEDIVLYTKYGLYAPDRLFAARLVNGIFQGSNDPDFDNADILHMISNRPSRLFTEVKLKSPKKYKYLRYKGGDSSFCNIAEVEFFSEHGKLEGNAIGTVGAMDNNPKHEFTSATDGRTETSFNHSTPGEGWTGIQISESSRITKIRYAPRNHDNFVKEGNDYELFVSTQDGWGSLGRKKAQSDSLIYRDVPIGGLFYLKNHTGGQEERIFVMENGRQVFR